MNISSLGSLVLLHSPQSLPTSLSPDNTLHRQGYYRKNDRAYRDYRCASLKSPQSLFWTGCFKCAANYRRVGRHIARSTELKEKRPSNAEHSFAFDVDQLSALTEDLIDGERKGIKTEDLVEGLVSSSHKGLTDTPEQSVQRRTQFGSNRLPERQEVRQQL